MVAATRAWCPGTQSLGKWTWRQCARPWSGDCRLQCGDNCRDHPCIDTPRPSMVDDRIRCCGCPAGRGAVPRASFRSRPRIRPQSDCAYSGSRILAADSRGIAAEACSCRPLFCRSAHRLAIAARDHACRSCEITPDGPQRMVNVWRRGGTRCCVHFRGLRLLPPDKGAQRSARRSARERRPAPNVGQVFFAKPCRRVAEQRCRSCAYSQEGSHNVCRSPLFHSVD